MKKKTVVFSAIFLMIFAATGLAETFYWGGLSGGDWGVASNWAPAGVPGTGDTVRFSAGAYPVHITTPSTAMYVVGPGCGVPGSLKVNSRLTVGDTWYVGFYGAGTVDINSLVEVSVASLFISYDDVATMNMAAGSKVTLTNGVTNAWFPRIGGNTLATADGTLNINGGTLEAVSDITVGWSGKGTLNLSSGSISTVNAPYYGGINVGWGFAPAGARATGTLNVSGGTIDLRWHNEAALRAGYGEYATLGSLDPCGVINISGGTVNAGRMVSLGEVRGNGRLNMTGGTLRTEYLYIGTSGATSKGHVQLDGGTIEITMVTQTGQIKMSQGGSQGTMDIAGGTLLLPTYFTQSFIDTYFTGNHMVTVYGGNPAGVLIAEATPDPNFMIVRAGLAKLFTDASGDHLWTTTANWSTGVVPSSDDVINFGAGSRLNITSGTINANSINTMNPTSKIDFRNDGMLVLSGKLSESIMKFVRANNITAYAGPGGLSDPRAVLNVRYFPAENKTKIWASIPDLSVAWNPYPANGQLLYGTQAITLGWNAGAAAATHRIYLGENFDEVNNATPATAGIYKTVQASTSYAAGTLLVGKTYYWRIDEVETGGSVVHKGAVWQFNLGTRETAFGFGYWPKNAHSEVLYDAAWAANKGTIAADLDLMASYHVKVLRQMIWPWGSGWVANNGNYFSNEFDQSATNMVEFIKMAGERGMKVVVSFGNNYYDGIYDYGPPEVYNWQVVPAYIDPSGDPNSARFFADTRTWINGFVDKIEASPWASTVVYYDYENELYSYNSYESQYIQYLFDNTNIPKGKRYLSTLRVDGTNDIAALKAILGSRQVDCVDFHSYPNYPQNVDIEYGYDVLAASYPLPTSKYIGEYSSSCSPTDSESDQQTTELNLASRAIAKGFDAYLHWSLWGDLMFDLNNDPLTPVTSGVWGAEPNSPRDIMGGMTNLFTPGLNPDMETLSGGVPTNWTAGGTVARTFTSGDGATNLKCARIQTTSASGSVWVSSAAYPVTGGKKLFVNCYIKAASMNNVSMSVTEYDASMNILAQTAGPVFNPASSSQWYSYVHQIPSWSVSLKNATRSVVVTIGGNVTGNPSTLDVDTVSVHESSAKSVLRYDFSNDGRVDFKDFALFAKAWLSANGGTGWDATYDIASPQDGVIDVKDLSVFASQWLSSL